MSKLIKWPPTYTRMRLYHTIDVHITEIIVVKLIKLKAKLIINNDYSQILMAFVSMILKES